MLTTTSAAEGFLRTFSPCFEDRLMEVDRPYAPHQHRWFRTPNVVDLMAHRRRLGRHEWIDHTTWRAGVSFQFGRPPASRTWPSNVVDLERVRSRSGSICC
jgi:hypothetical protein